MASQPLWAEDEWMLLLELYAQYQGQPPDESVQRLRIELRALAAVSGSMKRARAAQDPGFRTFGSIWSHLSVLRSIDQERLPIGAAPRRLRRPWRQYRHDATALNLASARIRRELSESQPGSTMPEESPVDEVRAFLHEVQELLEDVVRTIQRLPHLGPDTERIDEYTSAWEDLQERHLIKQMDESLAEPGVLGSLDKAGLTGPQLASKLGGWRRATAEWFKARTARSLRWALSHANTILGSLTTVIPGPAIEIFKEFKETTETTIDEVVPSGGYLPAPALV
jgi:hypothetical protein